MHELHQTNFGLRHPPLTHLLALQVRLLEKNRQEGRGDGLQVQLPLLQGNVQDSKRQAEHEVHAEALQQQELQTLLWPPERLRAVL